MSLWKPTHQFAKSLRDFLLRIPGLVFGVSGPLPPPAPPVPFVIRLGAAGPLRVGSKADDLALAVSAILGALKKYTESTNPKCHKKMFPQGSPLPNAQLRLVCQLASGFDQIAASAATAIDCRLHIVLPGDRTAFRHDIQRNSAGDDKGIATEAERGSDNAAASQALSAGTPRVAGGPPDPVAQFEELIKKADRLLEPDRDDESGDESPFSLADYAQAGAVILDHSDIVLVAIHEEHTPPAEGGTRWIEKRAEKKQLPVIRVPVDRPFEATLIWTVEGRREERRLFATGAREANSDIFADALDARLLGPSFDLAKIRFGWLERRMAAQLDPKDNATWWGQRWRLDASNAVQSPATQDIDHDFKAAKVWADHRASAMAELVRGSFIVSALLGVVAVFGALLELLIPPLGFAGKILETSCLFLIFWLIWRSRRYDWRSQWLSLRQLERFVEQAAWLAPLGRGRIYETPSHLARFQADDAALWTNAYFRAVIRNASFPTAHFTQDYLKTARALVLENLVADQIAYFQREVPFHHKSDKVLERWTAACVIIAGSATLIYLIVTVAKFFLHQHWMLHIAKVLPPENLMSVIGALLTATAASLSAIRNHGEYAQIAARFEGAEEGMRSIQNQLAARHPPLRSAGLASIVGDATDILIQEVQGWRAILQKKEIEPT